MNAILRMRERSSKLTFPYRFVTNDGFIPILKYLNDATGEEDCFFIGESFHDIRENYGFTKFSLKDGGFHFGYRFNDRDEPIHVSIGLYSLFTCNHKVTTINNDYGINQYERSFLIEDVDLHPLVIGAIKISDIRKVEFTYKSQRFRYRHEIKIDPSLVTIFVSEKVKSAEYMKAEYSSYFQRKVVQRIGVLKRTMNVKYVPQSYLESFIQSKSKIKTNSLLELKEIETKIVNHVFSNMSVPQT